MITDRARSLHAIPSLDGVRAVAIVIVFLGHAHLPHFEGSVGVTVFFFLSGYLITTLLRIEQERTGRIRLGEFYLRRTLRILPPLYVTLAAILVLDWTGVLAGGSVRLPGVLAAAFDGANYVSAAGNSDLLPRGSGIFWSVAVEEHFYLLFPLLYLLLLRRLRRRRDQAVVLAALCVAITAWRAVLGAHHASWAWINYATDARADSILLGCLLAIAANPYLDDVLVTSRVSRRAASWVLVPVGLVLVLLDDTIIPAGLRVPLAFEVQGIGLMLIFTAIVAYPGAGLGRLLNLRPVAYLGVLSYCFYLTHRLVQIPLQETFDLRRSLVIVIGFPIACLVSWLMHVAIELPSARLRRQLSGRFGIPWTVVIRDPAVAPATPEVLERPAVTPLAPSSPGR